MKLTNFSVYLRLVLGGISGSFALETAADSKFEVNVRVFWNGQPPAQVLQAVEIHQETQIANLLQNNSNPLRFWAWKSNLLNDLGAGNTAEVSVIADPLLGDLYIIPQRMTGIKIYRSPPNQLITIRCYDKETYYGVVIMEAKSILNDARSIETTEAAEPMARFFSKMESAYEIKGERNTDFCSTYTEGIVEFIETQNSLPDNIKLVNDWFERACLSRYETDPENVRTLFARALVSCSKARSQDWLDSAAEMISRGYEIGLESRYGVADIWQTFRDNGRESASADLCLTVLGHIVDKKDAPHLAWFRRAVSSARGISELNSNEEFLDEYISDLNSLFAQRRISAESAEIGMLNVIEAELATINNEES